ncbi:MAG: NADH-quinone oxidoreductase subunit C [Treponema sp.]|nr:NADH-quinone oxidoreductase subunit C [Treponema sp.]
MPEREEALVKKLTEKFNFLEPRIQRERRIWADVPREKFLEVLRFLRDELNFYSLCSVTGLDCGEHFQLVYNLAETGGIVFGLKEIAPKTDPVFDTATDLYKGGVLYELEASNLLGLTIRGIPGDIRYPLPDSWPQGQYPLRKDWTNLPGKENNNNVKSSDPAGTPTPGPQGT